MAAEQSDEEVEELTDADIRRYLKSPAHCPFCESQDIEGGRIEVDDGGAYQSITCNDCESEWDDAYELDRIVIDGTGYDGGKEDRALSPRELATVLAALRYWQRSSGQNVASIDHALLDIATDGGTLSGLTDAEIDALCERLNCS